MPTTGLAPPPDEGLSYVRLPNGQRLLLKAAVDSAGDLLLGKDTMEREKRLEPALQVLRQHGTDPASPAPVATSTRRRVGRRGKPEAYYFPPQYNPTDNNYPYTFMGLEPGTTRDQVRRCLENWNRGDNGITYLSRAYRLERGSGWQIDPGILHAPGSLLTYEPQVNSDVFAMFQSEVEGRITPWELLVKDVPPDRQQDLDYIIDLLDWDANVNPRFAESNRYWPKPVKPFAETEPDGYREQWVTYGTRWYSAKELTVLPKRTVTIKDAGAYGLILTQGHGTFGSLQVSTPAMIRFGQMTEDELFVTADAAAAGVRIENRSDSDPLVILKHFGPGNPEAPGR